MGSKIEFKEVEDFGPFYLIPLENVEYHIKNCLVLEYQYPIHRCNIAGKLVLGFDCDDFKKFLETLADKCMEKVILEKDRVKRENLNVNKLKETIHNSLYTLCPFGIIIRPDIKEEEGYKSKLITSKGKILSVEDISKFRGKMVSIVMHKCMIVVHKIFSANKENHSSGVSINFLLKEAIFD